MTPSLSRGRTLIVIGAISLSMLVGAMYLYLRGVNPPPPGSPAYERYVNAFQLGVALLDADHPKVAEENLTRAIKLIPREPAGWANRGLLYTRASRYPEAAEDLQQAVKLVPNDPEVQKILGLLKQKSGKFSEAAEHLRRALERDGEDIEALYLLAQVVSREHLEGSDTRYQRLLEQILAVRPDNLKVLVDRLQVAVRRSDRVAVNESLKRFEELSPEWLERTRKALAELKQTLAESFGPDATSSLLRFSNVLKGEARFARHAADVQPKDEFAGHALQTFRWLSPVKHSPASPDKRLTFSPHPIEGVPNGNWNVVAPVWLTVEETPVLFLGNDQELRRVGGATTLTAMPGIPSGLVAIDWNNDLRTDLVQVGKSGLRFHQQQKDGKFIDVTSQLGLADDEVQIPAHSALAADLDLDGDLDVLISRPKGAPRWLRNNLDGTFTAKPIFSSVEGALDFASADLDHDGAPDVFLLDEKGNLHAFSNERSGQFIRWSATPSGDRLLAITAADVNDDGAFDIVALRADGSLIGISARHNLATWSVTELGTWPVSTLEKPTEPSLLIAVDLDNNGALDILASGSGHSAIWLGQGGGRFESLISALPPRILAVADLLDRGRMDLFGFDHTGRPTRWENQGEKKYHWQIIRPQAAQGTVEGDNRINSFGIGGDIELRAGTHVVKQPIVSPAVHFGLGERPLADIVRIQWPNGAFQFEFTPTVNQSVVAVQRLIGSCPFLYAWNGERFDFVTDFMWSTPLGMYINASDKGGFLQTTDWVKIPGQQLVPRNGLYELRVNANLWETHFFDHMTLMLVDHPADTEMFVDERFFMEPTPPSFTLTGKPRNITRAIDHHGNDVTADVRTNDAIYLDRIQRGQYQGVCEDHWVEVHLDKQPVPSAPVWLVARGWMHPTDSSVNFALEQGQHVKPQGLSLEVPDGHGGWKIARDKLGFPTGKNKTILIRLDGLDGNQEPPQQFRLRTNLEIYWDSMLIADGRDDSLAQRQILTANHAELGFRGIVAMTQANRSSPEMPHYDQVVSTGQYWRDLIGYHTRFGDIGELLKQIDDRYAIICAGDEVTMRFAAPAGPKTGWKRDFVWIADGWVKDGNYNTRFGKTVLPLPSHDMTSYDVPPRQLEDDPVYLRFRQDWQTYHTRYVTPYLFQQGLRGYRRFDDQDSSFPVPDSNTKHDISLKDPIVSPTGM